MTGPIQFAKLPYPLIDADADSVAAQRGISSVAAENFAKINPYFTSAGTRIVAATSMQTVSLSNVNTDGTWRAIAASQWAPVSLVLPKGLVCLLAVVSCEMWASANGRLYISYQLSGPGHPDANNRGRTAQAAGAQPSYGSKATVFIPGDPNDGSFFPGQTVTATPQVRATGAGTNNSAANGTLQLIAFAGEPSP